MLAHISNKGLAGPLEPLLNSYPKSNPRLGDICGQLELTEG